jgi:hypothetical protein
MGKSEGSGFVAGSSLLQPYCNRGCGSLRGRWSARETRGIGSYLKAWENGLISENEVYPDEIQPRVDPSFTHLYHGQIHTGPGMFIRDGADEPGPQPFICA